MVATKKCFTVLGLFKPPYVKTHYKRPRDTQTTRNGSALRVVLAQGASNKDIAVHHISYLLSDITSYVISYYDKSHIRRKSLN